MGEKPRLEEYSRIFGGKKPHLQKNSRILRGKKPPPEKNFWAPNLKILPPFLLGKLFSPFVTQIYKNQMYALY